VRFGETDLQGVVYYANYLLFAEVGRIAYLRELGIVYERDLLAHGVDFTIGEARVRYHAPLRFDDEYDIRVRVGEIRHSSWAFDYAIDRATGRPTRIPEGLRETLVAASARAGRPAR
jgi:acyl-CoA thioester hydrolase